ncbi:MAG: transposase, partial [Proteobacteria bacterium]|nr:transposase [Pseudomonadota bacterium]
YLYSFGNESWWVSLIGGEKTKKRSGGSDYRRWMGPILIGGNNEVAARHLNDQIIMVVDGAGWHRNESLIIPDNIRLLRLPPYSPELNPVEHVWDDLREKEFHNRVFDSIDSLEDHLERAIARDGE